MDFFSHMRMLVLFTDKCFSLLRIGRNWFDRLIGSIVEAGRTISYVENANLVIVIPYIRLLSCPKLVNLI